MLCKKSVFRSLLESSRQPSALLGFLPACRKTAHGSASVATGCDSSSPSKLSSCLPVHQFSPQCCHLQSLLAVGDEKKAAVKRVLEKMCAAMLTVTKRQLADFLPEPKRRYHNIQDPQLRIKLAHSHITNLVAENCFADLDFSLFKQRSCSLFHHSTVQMLKQQIDFSMVQSQDS